MFDKTGAYGRVQVLRQKIQLPDIYQKGLVNGGRFEGFTVADAVNQKLIAYLPLAIHNNPRTLLNIGLGTGMTLATAADDRRLQSIDNEKINQLIYEAVDEHFYPGLFNDRRMQGITDDAQHLKPKLISSQRIFCEIASRKLSKDGLFVKWLPVILLKKNELYSTAKRGMT